jgi:hypothetical protein
MRTAALTLAALVVLASETRADGMAELPAPVTPTGGWSYQFTPYGWTPWVQGNATIRGRNFNVYASPVDVLEHLDFAWMSYMQAKKGPLTLFTDFIYVDESTSGSVFTSDRITPGISATLGAALSADYQFWTIEFGGMYEIGHWRSNPRMATPDTVLEMIAGGRYWHQELDVTVNLAGTLNIDGLDVISASEAVARSGAVQWIDPFIGARLRYYPAPGEELWVRGDIGGFGAGSKFTWQAMAAYNWFLCTHGALTLDGYLGYRALSVDYEDGSGTSRYVFDVVQHGPVVGVTGRF